MEWLKSSSPAAESTVMPEYNRTRTRLDELGRGTYLFLITLFIGLGIAFSGVVAYFTREVKLNWIAFLVLFAITIVGVILNTASQSPAISAIGYIMVAGPFGVMFAPLVSEALKTDASHLWRAFFLASAAVIVFGVIGAVMKTDLGFLSSAVVGALVAAIVAYLGLFVLQALGVDTGGALGWLDIVVVILFMGITVYDLNQAVRDNWTLDNAVDYALSVYLNWVNIFIRFADDD